MTTPHWTAFLAPQGARLDDGQIDFADQPSPDATVLVPLVHLGLIRSSGEDAASFLHNLLSNDLNKLPGERAQLSSFNSPKGRMLASLLIWRDGADVVLALSADIHAAMLKKLSMYILRSKAKLSDASAELALFGISGADSAAVLAAAGLPCPAEIMQQVAAGALRVIRVSADSLVVAVPAAEAPALFDTLRGAGAQPAGSARWTLAMIRAGVPLITAATQEAFVAQMLNFELIGGVSFQKGCYPGQEIVARTQYLGKLKKRMYRAHIDTTTPPVAGTDLYAADFGEQSAGQLVNVAPAPQGGFEALAVLQTSSHDSGEVRLGAPDGPVLRFLDLPYALP